jgi:creatinine amidohydrolase
MRTVHFALLRPAEIVAERERIPVVYQPLGPLEWHGPHLPLGTDPLHAEAVACRVAEAAGGVVMPTLFWGTERERPLKMLRDIGFEGHEWIVGMDYPANIVQSLYSPEDIFGVVVRARLDLLVRQQYQLIVMINGHGADNHIAVLDRLAAEYTAAGPARVLHIIAFVPDPDGKYRIGHADAVETSLMMALHPESVDLEALPPLPEPLRNVEWAVVDGPTFNGQPTADHTVPPESDPRRGSAADIGETVLAYSAEWIAGQVQAALSDLKLGR